MFLSLQGMRQTLLDWIGPRAIICGPTWAVLEEVGEIQMPDSMSKPLIFQVHRGGRLESRHRIAAAVTRNGRLERSWGDVVSPVFPRSSEKLIQATPLVSSGAVEEFDLGDEEIAIACGSHSGTRQHCRVVEEMLEKGDLSPSDLQCGTHAPIDEDTAQEARRCGAAFTQVQNNCSGKHAGMLLLARFWGEPIESYRDPQHRVQKAILETLRRLSGCGEGEIRGAVDGCGAPAHALPLSGLALAYEGLSTPDRLDEDLARGARQIRDAIRAHPIIYGGEGRLTSRLVEVAGDRLLPKAGAEGVFALGVRDRSLGIAVKCEDGGHRGSRAALLHLLLEAGLVTEEEADQLRPMAAPPVRNFRGEVTGGIDLAWDAGSGGGDR